MGSTEETEKILFACLDIAMKRRSELSQEEDMDLLLQMHNVLCSADKDVLVLLSAMFSGLTTGLMERVATLEDQTVEEIYQNLHDSNVTKNSSV
jgi:hypothetical protein